ncbi:MAG: urease accessory protein UreH, partial [Chloroflexota bacterium]|nr:urease accessory protein UreH [Chloroflexota bacterium]
SREREHQHFHAHQAPPAPGEHHGMPLVGRPVFRLKSYVIGTIHGMAGSAALMLIVLTTLKSVWVGVGYILLFGAGTMLSMGLLTVLISLPFSASARLPAFNRLVQIGAGVFSIAFGAFIMYQNGIAEGLLHFGG